jgi:hypothetical protein
MLVILQFLVVAITDYSGFTEDAIKPLFKKWFGVGTPSKIFICSFCQNWWLGLLALLVTGSFTLPWIAAVMGFSILTPVTYLLIGFIRDLLEKIIETFYNLFGL